MEGPVDVFISYAPGDDQHVRELEEHLALLKRDGAIRAWYQRLVPAGGEPRTQTAEQLGAARIVILLVSASYVASDYLHDHEMQPALASAALVLPVVVRAHDLANAPYAHLQILPRNRVPVERWPHRDDAWAEVASEIRQVVETLGGGRKARPTAGEAAPPTPLYEDAESRLLATQLDAARVRQRALAEIGAGTASVDQEILDLRRRLREGGRLRAGDALGEGRYRLIETLGRGGFAVVWSAFDSERGERVAVKVLHAELAGDPQRRERFFRGARVMAGLGHEAVVRVLCPKGDDGGHLFFVMELVPGGDLQHAVVKGTLPRERVVPILLGVGEALAEAHAKGIVHRDVKPANILVDGDGAPRLTDFDLVTAGDTTGGTRTGAAMGSWVYMAPEQRGDAKQVDARADVYALGMTALFCLHGGELPDIREAQPEEVIAGLACSEAVKQVVTCAIAVKPGKRYADARAFCEALRAAAMPAEAPRVVEAVSPRMEMVAIPGGTFWMGSSGDEPGALMQEKPRRQVTLSPYWMARTPITQKLYREVTNSNPGSPVGDNLPINMVSWIDAVQFCNRLSAREGLTLAYRESGGQWVWDHAADGYRLPTEAEWEYAARGTDGRAYSWGNALASNQLSWDGEGNDLGRGNRVAPSPVGSYPTGASPFGLLDMAGNVWEWCWDWYAPYAPDGKTMQQDPQGPYKPINESRRVLRGGAWNSHDPFGVRAAVRDWDVVSDRVNYVGFRCARGSK